MADILRNPLTGLFVLAAAAGGPYLMYETEVGQQGQHALSSATQGIGSLISNNPADPNSLTASPSAFGPGMLAGTQSGMQRSLSVDPFNPQNRSMDQLPVMSLADVLRFDISPDWVISRFPRVSTLLSDTQLDGMRAPLITGSSPSDLAGTVTYYFDRYKQLKRLTVHATVGDPTRFVAELQRSYQMSQEPSLGGSLYAIKWNGSPTSLLHVSPASVVYNDLPYGRFNLFLELNQAGLEYGLSQEAQRLIDAGRQAQRW
jgi:hypothetical protein